MKTAWHELYPYQRPKPFVRVRLYLLDGQLVADYLALLDLGSRRSLIPGVVVSEAGADRTMNVQLLLPSGERKGMVAAVRDTDTIGIWQSDPQMRAGFDFLLELGGQDPDPFPLFLVPPHPMMEPPQRRVKPHLILGCDFLLRGSGLCVDPVGRRFRLSLCPSEAAATPTSTG